MVSMPGRGVNNMGIIAAPGAPQVGQGSAYGRVNYGQVQRPTLVQQPAQRFQQRQPQAGGGSIESQIAILVSMGFERKLSKEALYHNATVQKAISWMAASPIPLSSAWEIRKDASSGRVYYANREGKFTQWDRPIIPASQEASLRSLLGMGFPRRLCVEALAHYKGDAQSATNWIIYNTPKPLPKEYAFLLEKGTLIYLHKPSGRRQTTRPLQPGF